jgi:hypothetical protein
VWSLRSESPVEHFFVHSGCLLGCSDMQKVSTQFRVDSSHDCHALNSALCGRPTRHRLQFFVVAGFRVWVGIQSGLESTP